MDYCITSDNVVHKKVKKLQPQGQFKVSEDTHGETATQCPVKLKKKPCAFWIFEDLRLFCLGLHIRLNK